MYPFLFILIDRYYCSDKIWVIAETSRVEAFQYTVSMLPRFLEDCGRKSDPTGHEPVQCQFFGVQCTPCELVVSVTLPNTSWI